MSDWLAISQWHRCAELARPGLVFEIRNDAGQSLLTPCVQPLPAMPRDWRLPPVAFRAVAEQPPLHSDPIPPPRA